VRGLPFRPNRSAPQAPSFSTAENAERRGRGAAGLSAFFRVFRSSLLRPAAAVSGLVLLAGCSQGTGVTRAPGATRLDCSPGYEAVKARIAGQPGLTRAPKEPGEPYDWYSSADQQTSYVITEPGAPGHPAIVMERAAGGGQAISGCSYGDKAGYQQLLAYLTSLRGARTPK